MVLPWGRYKGSTHLNRKPSRYPKKTGWRRGLTVVPKKPVYARRPIARTRRATKATSGYVKSDVTYAYGRKVPTSSKFIKKVREAISNTETWTNNYSDQSTASIGGCRYYTSYPLYTSADLFAMSAKLPTTVATSKYIVENAVMTTQICNMSAGAVNLRVYEYKARRDIPSTTSTSGGNGAIISPSVLITQGFSDDGTVSAATDISSSLFNSSTFVAWCKILNTKLVQLGPGETKIFTLMDKSPHLINMEIFNPGAISTQLWCMAPYFARGLVFQHWGQPVDDSSTTTLTSTDRTKLSIIHTVRYNYKWSQDYSTSYTISASSGLGAVSSLQYIQEDTGAVVTDTQA